MIDEKKFSQYGYKRSADKILGITVHETGNFNMNALELETWLNKENLGSNGCHYICDDTQTVQVMPDDWAVYHTGKGNDWGNEHTIAIEICSSLSNEKYNRAESRAISLIFSLQKKYRIPMDMIFFHQDFNEKTYCPKRLLDNYGNSKNFVYQKLREV